MATDLDTGAVTNVRGLSIAFACLALSACLHGQGGQTQFSPSQINFVAHFASPPIAPLVNSVYMFVDASASGVCSGGGSATAWCRWSGTGWVAVGAAFTGLGDPGSNSIPYRNGPGTTVPAIASNFPTLNQSTLGTAAALTSTPTLCSTGYAPTGVLANGNATGCALIQVPFGSQTANFALMAPNGTSGVPTFRAIVAADIPTLNQATTANAATATALAIAPGLCSAGSAPVGIVASGNSTGCIAYVQDAGDLAGTAAVPVVAQIQGAAIPASAALVGTNSSKQLVAVTVLPTSAEPAYTGDVTKPAASLVTTLATVNSGPGTCGDATHTCQITDNGKGLVTAQSAVAITAGSGTINTDPQYDLAYYSGAGTTNTLSGASIFGVPFIGSGVAPVAANGNTLLNGIVCPDVSGSGTAQVCNTNPTFTVAALASILYWTTTTNTGALTINVNSSGAIQVYKFGGILPVTAGDIVAFKEYWLFYGVTSGHWEMGEGSNIGPTPTAYAIPQANSSGLLATGWIPPAVLLATSTNCSNGSSPAGCGAAPTGAVAIPTGVTSVSLVVNTTAVTANSRILLTSDDSLTISGATCNSTLATLVGGMAVTARTPGTSFTITYNGTIATNPLCVSYILAN